MKRAFRYVPGVLLLSAAVGAADNTEAAKARPLMLGEVERTSFTDAPLTERWYVVSLVAARSYAGYAWAPGVDPEVQNPGIAEIEFFTDALETPATTVHTADQEVHVNLTGYEQAQTKIIPSTTGVYWMKVSTSTTPVTSFDVDVLLVETTLFAPYWYINSASELSSFIEFFNTTDSAVTLVLRVYDFGGSEVGVQSPYSVTAPANGSGIVILGPSYTGVPEGFGSAQIAHTGPPGAVVANMTILSTPTGLSFDMPFEPRMRWTPLGRYP